MKGTFGIVISSSEYAGFLRVLSRVLDSIIDGFVAVLSTTEEAVDCQ